MTMADTVAVMNGGRIEQMGAPEDLYELPRTAFVANFLGQSNLLVGTVLSGGDRLVVEVAGHRLGVAADRARRRTGRVTLGVRPEKLHLLTAQPEPADGVNVLGPGRVTDVSFSGVSTQYLVEVPSIGTLTVFAQNMASGPTVSVGSEVWVSWRVEHGFGLDDDPGDTGAPADPDAAEVA